MKKKLLLHTCIAISLIMLLGFTGMSFINYMTFSKVSNESIENIARLTSSTIYAEIDNDLTKPIYVSQTMANDTFLKEWMINEKNYPDDEIYQQRLMDYLNAFRNKYNYDSIFVVSAQSDIYYHYAGINKIVSTDNAHDVWYYDFLKSGKSYDLDVDTDEAGRNELTVFVNCRIQDEDGTLLGVVGVGVRMSQLQQLLKQYEDEFSLEAFLINPEGKVQVHTDSSKIEEEDIFDYDIIAQYKDEILSDDNNMRVFWYPQDHLDHCLITRYIDNLDWYLVVNKDTHTLSMTFQALITNDILIAMLILLLILLLCIHLVRRYDRIVTKMATTDELTGLPNRKWFGDLLLTYNGKCNIKESYLFIMDIDKFKLINDSRGHLFGDQVLCEVADLLKEVFGSDDIIARWGGDEFIGVFESSEEGVEEKWRQMIMKLSDQDESRKLKVSISFGVTRYQPEIELDQLLGQADIALYRAKETPDNAIVSYSDAV